MPKHVKGPSRAGGTVGVSAQVKRSVPWTMAVLFGQIALARQIGEGVAPRDWRRSDRDRIRRD